MDSPGLTYECVTPEELAHLKRAADMVFAAFERQPLPLASAEREWFAAELKRRGET